MVFTQYLTVILNSVRDMVLLIDIEHNDRYRMVMANSAFFTLSGYTKESIGKTVDAVLPAESYKKLAERYKKVVQDKRSIEYTDWFETPTGRKFFEIKLIPIFNAMGECVQIAAVTHDGTQLHNMKEQQKEAAETLEHIAFNLRSL